ncbi:hypothetical protein B0T16DRAFT_34675 [Cercophora newfieldiana]|uniref:Uncharacterized protein n=1 Tax=Cercophora newfieldiana TaxID=92897 RepID=A0AA39YR33_9PEZI|nr:hypothetical protein B0T16DRAFT_34675 [Cercophora newfieldiana]
MTRRNKYIHLEKGHQLGKNGVCASFVFLMHHATLHAHNTYKSTQSVPTNCCPSIHPVVGSRPKHNQPSDAMPSSITKQPGAACLPPLCIYDMVIPTCQKLKVKPLGVHNSTVLALLVPTQPLRQLDIYGGIYAVEPGKQSYGHDKEKRKPIRGKKTRDLLDSSCEKLHSKMIFSRNPHPH